MLRPHWEVVLDFEKYISNVHHGFTLNENNGVKFFTIPLLHDFKHAFTARVGGVSIGGYSSLNLNIKREPEGTNVLDNFKIAASAIGFDFQSIVICNYEHGLNVELVNKSHNGMGLLRENLLPVCDGVAVTHPGTTATALHADCTPIFFADKKRRIAGVAHAGWRGTLGGMTVSISKFLNKHGVDTDDMLFGIGPSIGTCCFEVKDDVSIPFVEKYGDNVRIFRENKQYIDLLRITLMQLQKIGVPANNICIAELCTVCNSDLFFSFRRDGAQTGAMASMITL